METYNQKYSDQCIRYQNIGADGKMQTRSGREGTMFIKVFTRNT